MWSVYMWFLCMQAYECRGQKGQLQILFYAPVPEYLTDPGAKLAAGSWPQRSSYLHPAQSQGYRHLHSLTQLFTYMLGMGTQVLTLTQPVVLLLSNV